MPDPTNPRLREEEGWYGPSPGGVNLGEIKSLEFGSNIEAARGYLERNLLRS